MDPTTILILAVVVIGYGLVSRRIEGTPITPPMIFTGIGVLLGPLVLGAFDLGLDISAAHLLGEVTLILVLFVDASRIRFRQLRTGYRLPLRMLAIGMPLTIGLGTLAAKWLIPGLSWTEAALLAAILAPTDAALGQAVVSSRAVPVRIRQALNVESGLNDGIAVPVVTVLLLLALAGGAAGDGSGLMSMTMGGGAAEHATVAAATNATTATDATAHTPEVTAPLPFALRQLGFGPLAGVIVGFLGSWLIERAVAARWMNRDSARLAGVAIAFAAAMGAEAIGGNGFIAAFVAGMVVGNRTPHVGEDVIEFAETDGNFLVLLAFLAFGAAASVACHEVIDGSTIIFVVLALTVVRMVPVAIALIGTGLRLRSVLFLGWFGPRGLASLLFGLMVAEAHGLASADLIFAVTALTVLSSVVVHGLTAAPAANAYGRWAARLAEQDDVACEHGHAPDLPTRGTGCTPPAATDPSPEESH